MPATWKPCTTSAEESDGLRRTKAHLCSQRIVLRSKKPDLVRTGFYRRLLAHYALRKLMHEAALQVGLAPDRLSLIPLRCPSLPPN